MWGAQKRLSFSPSIRNQMSLCSWHILSAAFDVCQGRNELLALTGKLCWEEDTWASRSSLARSYQRQVLIPLFTEPLPGSCSHSLITFFISPSQTPVVTFLSQRVVPCQQKEQSDPPSRVTTKYCWIALHVGRKLCLIPSSQ